MANLQAKDSELSHIDADGDGTSTDPWVAAHTIRDGKDVAQGVTTVAAASSTVAQDGTARTSIGLLKGLINVDILSNAVLDAINTKLVSGTDIGDVTINNAAAAAAVNVQDGGNTLTVDGAGFSIPVTLTVTNGAYTADDVVGGLITLPAMVSAVGKHAMIYSVSLAGVTAIGCELWFLSADIATPAADNAPFTLVVADELLVRAVLPISTSDWHTAASSFAVAQKSQVGIEVEAGAAATSLYAYLVHTSTTSPGTTTMYLRITGEMVD